MKYNKNKTINAAEFLNLSELDLLRMALQNDMIDVSYVEEKLVQMKRKELLKQNPWQPWYGKDGFWHCYIPDSTKPRERRAIKRKEKKDIEDIIIEFWRAYKEEPTVEMVFKEWIEDKINFHEISYSTYTRYLTDFQKYFMEGTDFGKRRLVNIDEDDLERFMKQTIVDKHLTRKAYGNFRTLVYGIFRAGKKYVNFSVTQAVADMQISKRAFTRVYKDDSDEVFDEDELPIILSYLKEHPDLTNLGILLLFSTGMRVGELVTLKHSDVYENVIHICRTESFHTDESGKRVYEVQDHPKTDAGVRNIVIPTDDVWILKKIRVLNPFGEWMFLKANGERMRTNSIRDRLYNVCKACGLKPRSPHKIRKTYGSILLDNNLDERFIMNQMGHTTITVTEQHYHRNRKSIERKTEIINSISELKIAYN